MADGPHGGDDDLTCGIRNGGSFTAGSFHAGKKAPAFECVADRFWQSAHPDFPTCQGPLGKYFAHGSVDLTTIFPNKGNGSLLTMIGKNDPLVVAINRKVRGTADIAHGAIDTFERPMGECRVGTAAVRLFVIAEEVGVDDLHAAFDVEQDPKTNQLPQQDAKKDTRGDEAEFVVESFPLEKPPNSVHNGEAEF